jgi:hypothetical protein
MDVTKVNLDVAYVGMTKYTCCKRMFQVFHMYVANVFFGYFKIDLAVAHVANGYTCMFQ